MFTHNHAHMDSFPYLVRKEINGIRWYCNPDVGIWMPSVTTVISYATKGKYDDWKAKKGKARTDQIMKMATDRGTKLHKVIEYYLKNKKYTHLPEWKDIKVQWMFKAAKFYLDTRVDYIYSQEIQMYSEKLKVAGTPDVICQVDYENSILDIKGTGQMKPLEWLETYWIQLSCYWAFFSELTGIVPKKLIVFMVSEQMEVEIFEERNIMKYLTKAKEWIIMFYRDHEIPTLK